MKTLLLVVFAAIGYAQPYILGVQYTNVDPSPTCTIRSILISNYANGKLWQCQSGTYVDISGGGGGGGTVTSVALSTNLGTVSGSPVTTSGTLTNTVTGAQVVSLFTGCSGTQYLGADAACHNYSPGSGTVTSIATTSPITGGTITTTGTIACATCVTSAAALTSNLPVIGAGSQATAVGTRSGNTTQFVTTTGTQTSGDCVKIDANGNHVANGSACGSGGGSATATPPYITDSGTLYCGMPLQACTPPVAASFAWSHQPASATETANGSALIVHTVPLGSIDWAVRSQNISPNTTLDTLFAVTMNLKDFSRCGVGFLESSTTKMVTFTMLGFTSSPQTLWGTEAWSSYTGFVGPLTQSSFIIMPQNNMRVRLKYDGTNIYFYISNDGVSWLEFYRASKTTSFTTAPNKWFYGCDSQNVSTTGLAGDDYIELLHWLAF
jgi:hypothetical protein